ncbi:hypothetical protein BDV30DRAFT_135643 [Aspergillus minisclerotigenes]|uniref:Uncharacterized protein n=1 Tax=Aspergillus minisclerotigenes TaxID=656917 RepID=A0A5N6J000_9EURO|nr:hypothetical protein BDV30DRAFT_135643 [Aspergillus minisclerotigenes]
MSRFCSLNFHGEGILYCACKGDRCLWKAKNRRRIKKATRPIILRCIGSCIVASFLSLLSVLLIRI